VLSAYFNLNFDINKFFTALDRTNRRFYGQQSLFTCLHYPRDQDVPP